LIVLGPNGEQLINYHKRLLPPIFEASYFTPGTTPSMLELGSSKITALICYNAEFTEYVCQAALAGVDLVIVLTTLKAQRKFVSDSMLSTRALVNGLYVLYAIHAGAEGNS
jgi:predicted amidohydrolase